MKVRIGIDPGKDGYITIWRESNGFTYIPIPLIGKEVNYLALSKIFDNLFGEYSNHQIYAVIEDVHAIFGSSAKGTFSFGFIAGALEMLLICKGIPYSKIAPKAWQKQMWQGVSLQQKPSSTGKTMVTDTKSMSLIAAQRMFPNEDLRDNDRCKKPHDGKVDSLLICEYCKRNF